MKLEDQDRWAGTESSLGILLPRDFCEIIDIYGTGIWSNFLYLLNPFSKNTHLKSRRSSQEVDLSMVSSIKTRPSEFSSLRYLSRSKTAYSHGAERTTVMIYFG